MFYPHSNREIRDFNNKLFITFVWRIFQQNTFKIRIQEVKIRKKSFDIRGDLEMATAGIVGPPTIIYRRKTFFTYYPTTLTEFSKSRCEGRNSGYLLIYLEK